MKLTIKGGQQKAQDVVWEGQQAQQNKIKEEEKITTQPIETEKEKGVGETNKTKEAVYTINRNQSEIQNSNTSKSFHRSFNIHEVLHQMKKTAGITMNTKK